MSSVLHYKVCANEHGDITQVVIPAREFAFGTQNRFLLNSGLIFNDGPRSCIYATDKDLKVKTDRLIHTMVQHNNANIARLETANTKLLNHIKGEQ